MSAIHNVVHRPITRTDAIERAIVEELRKRRSLIDDNNELLSVTVEVKLQAGPEIVRTVTYTDQTLKARRL